MEHPQMNAQTPIDTARAMVAGGKGLLAMDESKSKKRYRELLEEHIEELSSLQRLHYASNRYALLPIFPGDGRRRQGRRHPARHVRGQSGRLPGF
jgi:hypothetical protein